MKVPDGWKEVNILNIAPITSRLVDPKDEKYCSMILIAPDHVQSKTGQILNKVTVMEQKAISGKYIVKKDDVIYSKIRPYLMKVCIAEEDCLCSADMYPLSCTQEIIPKYLQTILLSKTFTDYANSCSARTGIPKLNRDDFSAYNCFLPPLAEQKAIAEMLSVWDNMIEKMEQLIAKKKEVFNSLENYFFSSNKSTKIKHKIGEFVVSRNEQCIPSQTIPLYSLTIEDGITAKTDRYNRESLVNDIASKKYKIVYPGDIVFNPANLRWGAIARSKQNIKVAVSPIYEVLSVSGESVNPSYLAYYLTSKCQVKFYATKTEGTLIERMAVKIDAFVLFDVYIEEEINRQKEIVNILNCAEEEIDKLKQLVAQYKLQKQGLMQKLITGQWRIK